MRTETKDKLISQLALCLRNRNLSKCIDIRECLIAKAGSGKPTKTLEKCADACRRLDRLTERIEQHLREWSERQTGRVPRILVTMLNAYKPQGQESGGPLKQIRIRMGGEVRDMADCSNVVASLEKFTLFDLIQIKMTTRLRLPLSRPLPMGGGARRNRELGRHLLRLSDSCLGRTGNAELAATAVYLEIAPTHREKRPAARKSSMAD